MPNKVISNLATLRGPLRVSRRICIHLIFVMKEIPRESNHAMTCVWLGWIEGRSDIMREMPKVLKVFPSYSLRLLFDLPTPSNIV